MQYDPIKRVLGTLFNKTPFTRKIFYKLLDLLLLRTWHVKKELRIFRKNSAGNLNVLDAGAGYGQYSFFMSGLSASWNIKAVDVKKEQIDDCNRFFSRINRDNRVVFEMADLVKFIDEEKFSLILSVDVMEHIEDDENVFRNFHKSLKPGGLLLISTPSDKGGSDVHHHHSNSFIEEHVRDGYGVNEIKTKLEKAGFNNINTRYTYGKPGQVSWKLSMKYPILLLNFSKIFFIILPFYYLLTFPVSLLLNILDVKMKHKTGTGLVVKAWK
ncbi:MAG: methyltransferase domain-containing protein [Bacteroidales bacterium]|nr:methyltransferase domain-containing protein [Bacteroidales bacterium]